MGFQVLSSNCLKSVYYTIFILFSSIILLSAMDRVNNGESFFHNRFNLDIPSSFFIRI